MQVDSTGLNSHTTRRGNTIYYGTKSATSDDGSRKAAAGVIAFDKGSDGGIDAVAGAAGAVGPNGAVGAVGLVGPKGHSFAGGLATNYEAAKVWKAYA